MTQNTRKRPLPAKASGAKPIDQQTKRSSWSPDYGVVYSGTFL